MVPLVLDSVIALLLITTIIYCWRLSKRITLLHKSKAELQQFIQDFNGAIARAEGNIDELKTLSTEADGRLAVHIEQAKYLANDLSFLTEKGETIAEDLEQHIATTRTLPRMQAAMSPRAPKRVPTLPKRPPAAEAQDAPPLQVDEARAREIEQLLLRGTMPEKPASPGQMTQTKKQALDSVLSQIAAQKAAASSPKPEAPVQASLTFPAGASGAPVASSSIPPSLAAILPPPPTTQAAAQAAVSATAAKLNETMDRVFSKKRLTELRQQVETKK